MVSGVDGLSFSPVGGVELVAQAHGGALKTGGTPGNVAFCQLSPRGVGRAVCMGVLGGSLAQHFSPARRNADAQA